MERSSMKRLLFFAILLRIGCGVTKAEDLKQYKELRHGLFSKENATRTGSAIKLNEDEEKVNEMLSTLKQTEIDRGFLNGNYPPSRHFFYVKDYIEKSNIFRILKMMPKGAALHLHDSSMTDVRWVIKHATYLPNCYMCYNSEAQLRFQFYASPPTSSKDCKWKPVSEFRKGYKNPEDFDNLLYNNLTLLVDNPETAYPTITEVWTKFQSLFAISGGIVSYSKIFQEYYLEALQEFYDDNVQYLEFRAMLPPVYELDGTEHNPDEVVQMYYNLTQTFKKSHPDFAGAKLIYASSRHWNVSKVREAIKRSVSYTLKYPDFFAGYDLVGYEETGNSLYYFIEDLLLPSQTGYPLKYFFHAGETDWSGTSVDDNLIDALLLNTTRIGHGYAIYNHPEAKRLIKQKNIPIEVCPISNQVLKLTNDLRNHPASSLLTEGFPMVISADDPALWGARGLSYDWYMAYMGLGGAWADLRTLKQLAMDSIKYSAMSCQEKASAMKLWQTKWEEFINKVINEFNL